MTAITVACAAVIATVLTIRLFVTPHTDRARRTDAIVVLGPGQHGERFEAALRLLRRRIAPVAVVSTSQRPGRWPLQQRLCARPRAICFRPDPFTTRGEAREVARIAAAHGWRRLVLVTSRYHVTRTRLLHGRCFRGRIDVVAADDRRSLREFAATTIHEWGGFMYASVFARSC